MARLTIEVPEETMKELERLRASLLKGDTIRPWVKKKAKTNESWALYMIQEGLREW